MNVYIGKENKKVTQRSVFYILTNWFLCTYKSKRFSQVTCLGKDFSRLWKIILRNNKEQVF